MRPSDRASQLRNIAHAVIQQACPDGLPADAETELITSITRQLLTNDGHAGLMTARGQYWIKAIEKPDQTWEVGINHVPEVSVCRFIRDWDIDADLVPDILYRLTIGQSAEFTNRQGARLRFWIKPKDQLTNIELVTADSE